MWQRDRKKEREVDGTKDSTQRARETAWQPSPRGVGSFLWIFLGFFSFSPVAPSLFLRIVSCMLSVGVDFRHLPALSPSSSFLLSDSLLCTFSVVPLWTFIVPRLCLVCDSLSPVSLSPTLGPRCLEVLPISFSSSSSHCSSRSKMSSSWKEQKHKVNENTPKLGCLSH